MRERRKDVMGKGSRAKREAADGAGKLPAAGTIALVLLLALVVCAPASAAPLSMTFSEARANVGEDQLIDAALFEAPDTAPFEAQIDPGSGAITAGDLEVPTFSTHITDPIDADVAVEFEIGVITGTFNEATGFLTGTGEAGGTLTSEGRACRVSTTPENLTLSTAGNSGGASPRSGVPFTGGLAGAGAVAGQWTDMHATALTPGDINFCNDVDVHIGGPGGIWLDQKDIVPPAAPQLTSTNPASGTSSAGPRILGVAEAGSTVSILAGPSCAGTMVATGSAAELGSPGIAVSVAEGVTATFSAFATDAAGNVSACSGPISYTRLKGVGPPPPPVCVVPKLAGKTLGRAKRALTAAGCTVGTVFRPKWLTGKRRALVVKSSSPAAGARPASGKVHLKLGPKPRKGRG